MILSMCWISLLLCVDWSVTVGLAKDHDVVRWHDFNYFRIPGIHLEEIRDSKFALGDLKSFADFGGDFSYEQPTYVILQNDSVQTFPGKMDFGF